MDAFARPAPQPLTDLVLHPQTGRGWALGLNGRLLTIKMPRSDATRS